MLIAVPVISVGIFFAIYLIFGIIDQPSGSTVNVVLLGGLILALLIAAFQLTQSRTRRRVAQVIASCNSVPKDLAQPDVLSELRDNDAIEELCRQLAGLECFGFVLRDVPEADRQPPDPFAVPFQPVPLSRHDARFRELMQSTNAQPAPPHRPLLARLPRARSIPLMIVGATTLYVLSKSLWVEIQVLLTTGKFTSDLGFFLLVIASLIWALRSSAGWRSSCQWLLVAGGLVRRTSDRKFGWRVHVFEPQRSILIVSQGLGFHWNVHIADAECQDWLWLWREEALAMLRAWLSPLPPPKAEDLSDLE